MADHPRPTAVNSCLTCGKVHGKPDTMRCDCGACLYDYGTQEGIPQRQLDEFPLLRCTVCQRINFCD